MAHTPAKKQRTALNSPDSKLLKASPPTRPAPGLTLIESLVVLSIFALLMVSVTTIFISSLRAAAKARVIKEVRQNGSYAMGVITQAIRSAREITLCTANTKVDYIDAAYVAGSFECAANNIASGSASPVNLTSDIVLVSPCALTCVQLPGQPTQLAIDFTVSQVVA